MSRNYLLIWQPPMECSIGLAELLHKATGYLSDCDESARAELTRANEFREAELAAAGIEVRYVRASPQLVRYIIAGLKVPVSKESITEALVRIFDHYGDQALNLDV